MPGVVPQTVNAEQKAAVEHGLGPLLIVAGAGTGKTTVITQRIAWLILEKHVPTDGILALTFTDKAATEMEERVDRLLPYGYVNLWISTFHAFAERILRDHAIDIGLPGDFRLLNQTEQWLLIRRHLDRFELEYYRPLGNPTRFVGALLKHFSRLEDEDITPEAYLAYARSGQLDRGQEQFVSGEAGISEAKRLVEVAQAYATYRQLLLESSSLDFGTLITYTLELFKQRPALLEQYRQQFQYVLVDEFQDTNWAQYELIKLLAAPKHNLTVVGDDDQSIYKFRGASISNILAFRKDFASCQQVVLTTNYRSRQNILDLSYKFIQLNNPNRLEVALRDGQSGISKQLKSVADEPGAIELVHAATQEQEAKEVTERIITLQKKTRLDWREFAVLVRANDQAEQFAHGLELAGVPYQFVASKGLYRKPDVLDLIAYLRLLDNYHESPALFRLLNLPVFGIKPDDVVELNAYARRKGLSLYQVLIQSRAVPNLATASRKGLDELLSLIRHGTTFARGRKVAEVLFDFLKRSGLLAELGQRQALHAVERVASIRKFLEEVSEFEKSHAAPTVREFLEVFELKLESGDAGSLAGTVEPDADGVRLMTVHGAKGLEFAYVFIVQLVDRRFPTTERKDPIEVPDALIRETLPEGDIHLQEERRLLYVAMTRAKRGLFLTAAEDYGGQRAKKPSRFLYELGFIQQKPKRQPKGLAQLERQPRPPVGATDVRYVGSKYSFSALRSYEKCPWQFRYAYVLKVPVGGNALLSFGETMHRTLQRFFELVRERQAIKQENLFGPAPAPTASKSPVSLDELLQLYDDSFVDDWYEDDRQREQFRSRGRESLKRFYEQQAAKLPAVIGLEQEFNLKLDRFTVAGKMDRVDLLGVHPASKQRAVGIVDYKSGKSREMDSTDRYQLLIYALAAQDPNILDAKVERLSYYFLDDNQAQAVPVTAAELEKTKAWITAVAEKIQSGDFAATPGMVCKFCDYRDICEFRDPNY